MCQISGSMRIQQIIHCAKKEELSWFGTNQEGFQPTDISVEGTWFLWLFSYWKGSLLNPSQMFTKISIDINPKPLVWLSG